MLNLIVAVSKNNVIGIDGKIPWHIKEDMKRFKEITTGNVVVMGRKTYESIGKPLPNRTNVILTRDEEYIEKLKNDFKEEVESGSLIVKNSLNELIEYIGENRKEKEIFIIGGEKLYNDFVEFVDYAYITRIDKDFEGDTFFIFNEEEFIKEEEIEKETEDFKYRFLKYKKK